MVQFWSRKFYPRLFFCWLGKYVENELNTDNSTKIYLDKIKMLLDAYAPLKKI